jgi:hypothetical protein
VLLQDDNLCGTLSQHETRSVTLFEDDTPSQDEVLPQDETLHLGNTTDLNHGQIDIQNLSSTCEYARAAP